MTNLKQPALEELGRQRLVHLAEAYLNLRREERRLTRRFHRGDYRQETTSRLVEAAREATGARERLAEEMETAGVQAVRVGDKVVVRLDRLVDLDGVDRRRGVPGFATVRASRSLGL